MSEKTTTHVDTPLGPSTQRALDAVRDLHAAGQIATREAVSELTGDRLSVVDDRLRVLAVLPRKARVDAVIDLRDKLDRGDVWASDYQALLGLVEGIAA